MSASGLPRLIADIGGTNARFALVDPAGQVQADTIEVLACADHPTLVDATEHYLGQVGTRTDTPRPAEAVIDVATFVDSDRIKLTNHVWSFSIADVCRQLGLRRLQCVNDFAALALALPNLPDHELRQLGGGQAVPRTALGLIGSGTGLGVSGLIPTANGWAPVQGEGGHVTYGPLGERERQVLDVLGRRLEHVSAERLLAGMGFTNLYAALRELDGDRREALSDPAEISRRGLAGECPLCEEVLDLFCAILGTVAGNLVLTLGARGGLYIGGGIVPRLVDVLERSRFRQRFEAHGRFRKYLEPVPVYIIISKFPALTGLAQILSPQYAHIGVTCIENGPSSSVR